MRRTRLRAWVATWPDILVATLAACLAWLVAENVFGHRQPTFAATAAIVCLAPGVASRGRQALGFVVGVAIGIAVGRLEAHFVGSRDSLWVAALAAPAMAVAAMFGASAITVIQAGATAILLATGGTAQSAAHLGDAAIGAGLSLFVSQVLLSPSPVRLVEGRSRQMFESLANALSDAADGLAPNADLARRALAGFDEAMRHATDVTAALDAARGLERWTLRGRWSRERVERLVNRYDREATRLCASALLFGEALVAALPGPPPPPELAASVRAAAEACASLAVEKPVAALAVPEPSTAAGWARASLALTATLEALNDLLSDGQAS